MPTILMPASVGELVDKITILEIKASRILEQNQNKNIVAELKALLSCYDSNIEGAEKLVDLRAGLKKINETLWDIEDDIRSCERQSDFGANFVRLARSVYIQNDKRAALKREINLLVGSDIIEEKSYSAY